MVIDFKLDIIVVSWTGLRYPKANNYTSYNEQRNKIWKEDSFYQL
jgi:hypothetical protein